MPKGAGLGLEVPRTQPIGSPGTVHFVMTDLAGSVN